MKRRPSLFVILWTPWKVNDDYNDRPRIWAIYADEAESKRVYDNLLKKKTQLTTRGAFSWQLCENVNQEPDENRQRIEFGIEL